MTRSEHFKEFLQSISFRELTLSIDLLVSVYISYFYVNSLMNASTQQLSSVSWLSGLLLQVLIYSVILIVLSYLLLSFISDNELNQPPDVREKLEKQLDKFAAELADVEEALGDNTLYNDENKAKLKELITKQATLTPKLNNVEEELLMALEEMEQKEQAFADELA